MLTIYSSSCTSITLTVSGLNFIPGKFKPVIKKAMVDLEGKTKFVRFT